jgi:hypothetical protein
MNEIQAQAVYGDFSQPTPNEEPGYPKDQDQANTPNALVQMEGGLVFPRPTTPEELAREVQLVLYAAMSALVDNPARKRSQLEFLSVVVESLLDTLDTAYGELPKDCKPRLNALIESCVDVVDLMP